MDLTEIEFRMLQSFICSIDEMKNIPTPTHMHPVPEMTWQNHFVVLFFSLCFEKKMQLARQYCIYENAN